MYLIKPKTGCQKTNWNTQYDTELTETSGVYAEHERNESLVVGFSEEVMLHFPHIEQKRAVSSRDLFPWEQSFNMKGSSSRAQEREMTR